MKIEPPHDKNKAIKKAVKQATFLELNFLLFLLSISLSIFSISYKIRSKTFPQ
jgi:hypothetical protein